MTLYIETTPGSFSQWNGERLDTGELLPLVIEQNWTDGELANVRLYRPLEADPVPDGKVVTETTVKRVNGKVKFINTVADPIITVPQEISIRQAKLMLCRADLLDSANTALASLPGQLGEEARIEWETATVFRRDNPLITDIGRALKLSDATIDQLFIQAAKL